MGRALALIAVLLGAGQSRPSVSMTATNGDEPGLLEILGADGGVLWSGMLDHELKADVPAAERYQLRMSRDAGVLTTRITPASGVFRMKIDAERHHVAVETLEPAQDIVVEVVREKGTAPLYTFTNTGDEYWAVSRLVGIEQGDEYTRCWGHGGELKPHSTLSFGWVDETCLLEGAKSVPVHWRIRQWSADPLLRRTRVFVLPYDVHASPAQSRWVPEAPEQLSCTCAGTEIGPEHERLVSDSYEARTFRLNDGGMRVEKRGDSGPPRAGDIKPYVLPPGAETNPEFRLWR